MFESVAPPWKRFIIGALGLVLLVGLAGCSTLQLGYNQAPLLAHWWLGRYADFTSEQSARIRASLDDWHTWHRGSQLLVYADELAQLRRQATDNLSAEQMCRTWSQWQRHFALAAMQALPPAGDIARTLSAEQLRQIERHQARQLAEAKADFLQPTAAERQEAGFDRALKRAEQVYGRLDDAQRTLLRDALMRSPFDPERWIAARQGRQQAFLAQLRAWQQEPLDRPAAEAGLRRLVADSLTPGDAAQAAYQRRLTEFNCALAAQLHNSTTSAQRRAAASRLAGWEQDLRALAGR
jgi:hypothetical protein